MYVPLLHHKGIRADSRILFTGLLFTEPVVLFFSLWVAVAWGVFYALTSTIPMIFQGLYNFDTGRVGLVYLTLA